MRVGIASDHGGFALKKQIAELLRGAGHEVVDFGAHQLSPGDDYPDYVIPLANAVSLARWIADWHSAAAEWEHPSPQTRLPVCAADLYTMCSPPTRELKTTT